MKDSLELQEADASFKFMYTRLRRRSIQKPTEVVKLNVSTSERRMGALKKRVRKQVMIDRNEDCCTLTATKAEEALESSLLSLQNDSEPQGYARWFSEFINSGKWHLSRSSANKYFRSFKMVVNEWSRVGLDLQNGYKDFIESRMAHNQTKAATINNVIASVAYFSKHIAQDSYVKEVEYSRVRQYDPDKQAVFPLKYFEKHKFEELMKLMGNKHDLKHIILFGYYAGMRIFEIMKLKRKDIKLMEGNESISITVFGKGGKYRTTFIMQEHVVKYIQRWLSKYYNDEFLFMREFWSKWNSIDDDWYKAQRIGKYVSGLIKEKKLFFSLIQKSFCNIFM